MEKKKIVLCVVSVVVVIIVFSGWRYYVGNNAKHTSEIVWITESSLENVCMEMEQEFNALLKKRACEYEVRFACFPIETYEKEVSAYLENNSADIIYSNLRIVGDDSNQFYSFYKNGYLENLDIVRSDPCFYKAYPEDTWKTMEIDGEIYGIPAYSNGGNGLYYVFNKEYLDKYDIDISEVTEDLESIYPLLMQAAEKEKNNKSFVPMLSYEYMLYAPGYTELLDIIRVEETGTMPVAENLLGNKKIKDATLLLNEFHKQGLLAEGNADILAEGNFFLTIICADAPELIQEYFDLVCEEKRKPFLSLEFMKIGEHYTSYRTGGMNSVLKGENMEGALEVLKWTITDEEISNLLKYGNKEMEETSVMLQWMFGNDLWSKKTDNTICSSIAGFQFDGSQYKKQIDECSRIYYNYSELFRGLSEHPQEDYESLINEMKKAGIDEVTKEVNTQLEQWYKNRK